ncbi:MAG: hypothetical protein GWO11_06195 [Desulfuromonadales bacterium]|nr:hypothetical protein [Desulfuromonadales bacterium]NIR33960.1 hypothetical protein [Desulfuromonadales bacterium]NIS41508.1 hypothetical protein [Desulfuromonadales bacterium]
MLRIVLAASALAAYCALGSGCTYGLIYTHTVLPLDANLNRTLTTKKVDKGDEDVKHFSLYVDVAWDSNAIGDIARKRGFQQIDHADLELLSILGVWRQYTVHVYGR